MADVCECGGSRLCAHNIDFLPCDTCGHLGSARAIWILPGDIVLVPAIPVACARRLSEARGRTFDKLLDGRVLIGVEQLVYAARALVRTWTHAISIRDLQKKSTRLPKRSNLFTMRHRPAGCWPRCAVCGSTRKDMDVNRIVTGTNNVACSDGTRI